METNFLTSHTLRDPQDVLTPKHVAAQYGIAEQTQAGWRSTNKYGWREITLKAGKLVRYRRSDIDQWLEALRPSSVSRPTNIHHVELWTQPSHIALVTSAALHQDCQVFQFTPDDAGFITTAALRLKSAHDIGGCTHVYVIGNKAATVPVLAKIDEQLQLLSAVPHELLTLPPDQMSVAAAIAQVLGVK